MTHQTVRHPVRPHRPDWMQSWAIDLSKGFNTNIQKRDIPLIGFLLAGLCWISYSQPAIMLCFLFFSSISIALKMLFEYITPVGKIWRKNINLRLIHVASLICGLTLLLTFVPMPAQAVLFQAIEDQVTTLINGTGVPAATVALVFTALRIIVIFGFLVGGIYTLNQAMQGGDWKPMGNMLGIGLMFVISMEVITQLILN